MLYLIWLIKKQVESTQVLIKQWRQPVAELLAGFRHRHATPGAVEQLRAEWFLQLSDMPADSGMRNKKFFSRVGEAAVPGSGFEGFQGIEGWESACHFTCNIFSQAA